MVDKRAVIDSLRELADESIQRRRWLAPGGPEVSSFAEAFCQLFDDTGLGDAIQKKKPIFEPETDEGLLHLEGLLRSIDQDLPPSTIIESRQMQRVRYAAIAVLQKIDPEN